jgi:RND family efflux transporter MFP subunit
MIAYLFVFIHQLTSAASVIAVALGLVASKEDTNRSENPPAMVKVETVALSEYASVTRLTGDIRPRVESDLSFRVSGRIIERTVDVGDHVTAGQVLARLDPQQQQATMTAAQAAVRGAEAVLGQTTSTFERQKALLIKGFTTKRDHDQAKEAYRTAQASLDAATAQLAIARDELTYTALRADVSGVITARNAETGQVVQAAGNVFSIAQDGPRDAVFHVQESIFTHQPGNPTIELTLVSDPGVKARGMVREVSPTVDASNGTVRVKVDIEHPPKAMTLGAAVIGESRLQSRNLVIVPWSALSSENGKPAVWIINPQTSTVSLKPITIDDYETGKVVVREGLHAGDLIVTAGAQFLRPRQLVAFRGGAEL